jgi:hypothetical protein
VVVETTLPFFPTLFVLEMSADLILPLLTTPTCDTVCVRATIVVDWTTESCTAVLFLFDMVGGFGGKFKICNYPYVGLGAFNAAQRDGAQRKTAFRLSERICCNAWAARSAAMRGV